MFEVGRVCMKIAGRDAGKKCVVVDVLDKGYVLVDGETRRRKVNARHLEPLMQVVDVKRGASHGEVAGVLGMKVKEKKVKQKTQRPRRVRRAKVKAPVEKKKQG